MGELREGASARARRLFRVCRACRHVPLTPSLPTDGPGLQRTYSFATPRSSRSRLECSSCADASWRGASTASSSLGLAFPSTRPCCDRARSCALPRLEGALPPTARPVAAAAAASTRPPEASFSSHCLFCRSFEIPTCNLHHRDRVQSSHVHVQTRRALVLDDFAHDGRQGFLHWRSERLSRPFGVSHGRRRCHLQAVGWRSHQGQGWWCVASSRAGRALSR